MAGALICSFLIRLQKGGNKARLRLTRCTYTVSQSVSLLRNIAPLGAPSPHIPFGVENSFSLKHVAESVTAVRLNVRTKTPFPSLGTAASATRPPSPSRGSQSRWLRGQRWRPGEIVLYCVAVNQIRIIILFFALVQFPVWGFSTLATTEMDRWTPTRSFPGSADGRCVKQKRRNLCFPVPSDFLFAPILSKRDGGMFLCVRVFFEKYFRDFRGKPPIVSFSAIRNQSGAENEWEPPHATTTGKEEEEEEEEAGSHHRSVSVLLTRRKLCRQQDEERPEACNTLGLGKVHIARCINVPERGSCLAAFQSRPHSLVLAVFPLSTVISLLLLLLRPSLGTTCTVVAEVLCKNKSSIA